MTDKLTPEQIAEALRRLATSLTRQATELRTWANGLSPPDLPQASQASHHSG